MIFGHPTASLVGCNNLNTTICLFFTLMEENISPPFCVIDKQTFL